jgi:hypothetical protein
VEEGPQHRALERLEREQVAVAEHSNPPREINGMQYS